MKDNLDNNMINGTIAFIESRLTENLKINELAEQSFFSKTHYQRLFHSMVGETVMEYIKKRRLQLALDELYETKTSILEIALKYGYESHEGFTRAFKSYYGVTPSRYRKLSAGKKAYYQEAGLAYVATGSRAGFALREASEEVTKMRKVSNEVISRIKKNMKTVSEVLAQSSKSVAVLSESMKDMGSGLGNKGSTLLICSSEVEYLAKRMECLKESVNSFTEHEKTDFEIYGEFNALIKGLDDVTFQVNLLRFLSGIEMARAGEPKEAFTSIEKQFSELAVSIENNKSNMIDLINDIISLIRTDIKNNAVAMLKDAVGLLKNAEDEGKIINASAKNAADVSKSCEKGIMCIANILSDRIAGIKPITELFEAYKKDLDSSDLEKSGFGSEELPKLQASSEVRIAEIRSAIYSFEEIAFSMNLAAFNASIETARSGNDNDFVECAEKIRNYAGQLQQTCKSCTELFNDSVKLSDMLNNSRTASIISLTKKMIEDIAFQGQIMVTQLGLEAVRAELDVFKKLTKNADEALQIISKTRQNNNNDKNKAELSKYYEVMLKYTSDCHDEAAALGAKGMPFEYIASEYDFFIKRVKEGIDCL